MNDAIVNYVVEVLQELDRKGWKYKKPDTSHS